MCLGGLALTTRRVALPGQLFELAARLALSAAMSFVENIGVPKF